MRTSTSSTADFLWIAAVTILLLAMGLKPAHGQRDTEEQRFQQQQQEDDQAIRAEVARFQAAKNSREAGKLCLSLFPTPFDDSLELLLRHDDPHVAIQAAWRRYSRMVRKRDVRFGSSNESLDPRDVQRFLGFLEGRARVLVPKWWEQALADLERNLPHEERFRGNWLNANEILKKSDESYVTLEVNSESVRIPASTFKSLGTSFRKRVGVVKEGKRLLLMSYRSDAGDASLACVGLSQSKELWQADIWGLGEVGPRTGPPLHHYMTMKIVGDRVFIFGATRQGAYFESFALKDGTPSIRFATTNWFVNRPEK